MQYLGSRREGIFDWIVFHRPDEAGSAGDREADRA